MPPKAILVRPLSQASVQRTSISSSISGLVVNISRLSLNDTLSRPKPVVEDPSSDSDLLSDGKEL